MHRLFLLYNTASLLLLLVTSWQENKFFEYEVDYSASPLLIQDKEETTDSELRRLQEKPYDLSGQFSEDANYLKFHRCSDGGEVYAAAYIITKTHLINHLRPYNLSHANTELASFIMFSSSEKDNETKSGLMIQALDVFDFSVIHLSAFERLARKRGIYDSRKRQLTAALERVITSINQTRNFSLIGVAAADRTKCARTVAIMPYLGSEKGVGNSVLTHRMAYLVSTVLNLRSYNFSVVVGVKNMVDFDFIKSSGLKLFKTIYIPNIPTSASLPVATLFEAQKMMRSGEWDFDYVFFTESDQLLLMRPDVISDIYGFLAKYPRRTLVPHRLIPYPNKVLNMYKTRKHMAINKTIATVHWMKLSCCMPRQKCIERKSWIDPANLSLPFVEVHSLQVALGNCNFHLEKFRACKMQSKWVNICP